MASQIPSNAGSNVGSNDEKKTNAPSKPTLNPAIILSTLAERFRTTRSISVVAQLAHMLSDRRSSSPHWDWDAVNPKVIRVYEFLFSTDNNELDAIPITEDIRSAAAAGETTGALTITQLRTRMMLPDLTIERVRLVKQGLWSNYWDTENDDSVVHLWPMYTRSMILAACHVLVLRGVDARSEVGARDAVLDVLRSLAGAEVSDTAVAAVVGPDFCLCGDGNKHVSKT